MVTVGSICSGIEAASVAWRPLGMTFDWFSEVNPLPSKVLGHHYPDVLNVGDMTKLPHLINDGVITAPDVICGGTPCQAFSMAGVRGGLSDDRGNLTLSFVETVKMADEIRTSQGKSKSVVLWENVEGVLSDKTNAFGSLISSLAGVTDAPYRKNWPKAGVLQGTERNVAWRVLDAKFFGVPQQRKRVFLLSTDVDTSPEKILFEQLSAVTERQPQDELLHFKLGETSFEFFREYTSTVCSGYSSNWNGNAPAYNGSLFVAQEGRVRRFSPEECEKLMGFPVGYTNVKGVSQTARYKALGNSWAVPVVRWIGSRILQSSELQKTTIPTQFDGFLYLPTNDINASATPNDVVSSSLSDVVSESVPESLYLSPAAAQGILRRAEYRGITLNNSLDRHLIKASIERVE